MQLHNNFLNVLIQKLSNELTILSSDVVNDMKNEIQILPKSGSYDSVGASAWRENVMNHINFTIVNETVSLVRNIGLIDVDDKTLSQALLINYGMGTTLDTSNPYLSEYMSSDKYDSSRSGYRVYTRPDDYIFDYATGTYYQSISKIKEEIPYFHQNPAHFFENGITGLRQRLSLIIDNVFNNLNISGFVR